MSVVFLYFGLLLLAHLQSIRDVCVEGILFFAQHSHKHLQISKKRIYFLLPWVYFHRFVVIDFYYLKTLTCQQNSTFLAIVKCLIITVSQKLGSLLRIVNAHWLVTPPTHPNPIRISDTRLSTPRTKRWKWRFWSCPIRCVSEIHPILVISFVLSRSLRGLLVKLPIKGCFLRGSH